MSSVLAGCLLFALSWSAWRHWRLRRFLRTEALALAHLEQLKQAGEQAQRLAFARQAQVRYPDNAAIRQHLADSRNG